MPLSGPYDDGIEPFGPKQTKAPLIPRWRHVFTALDLKRCRQERCYRQDKRNAGRSVAGAKHGREAHDREDLRGVMGELATHHLTGMSLLWGPNRHGDPGYDGVLPDGRTCDSKATQYRNGVLLLSGEHLRNVEKQYVPIADVLVMVYVPADAAPACAYLLGWIEGRAFLQRCMPWKGGHTGTERQVPQWTLRPMDDLVGTESLF